MLRYVSGTRREDAPEGRIRGGRLCDPAHWNRTHYNDHYMHFRFRQGPRGTRVRFFALPELTNGLLAARASRQGAHVGLDAEIVLSDGRGRVPFWARGFCVSTVGREEEVIREYIRRQEEEDRRLDQTGLW